MRVFVYDGSLVGFLNIVFTFYTKKIYPDIISRGDEAKMFDEVYYVDSDEIVAKRVFDGMSKRFDKVFLDKISHIFLCDEKDFEINLLGYIIYGFKDKKNLFDLSNKFVFYVELLQKEIFKMAHKYKGFIRFAELESGELFATIEPKYNILGLIANHFVSRFHNQNFIIYDKKRDLALVYINQKLSIENIVDIGDIIVSRDEEKYQKLWRKFFEKIAIKQRENTKRQKSFIPLWYRKHMLEFD